MLKIGVPRVQLPNRVRSDLLKTNDRVLIKLLGKWRQRLKRSDCLIRSLVWLRGSSPLQKIENVGTPKNTNKELTTVVVFVLLSFHSLFSHHRKELNKRNYMKYKIIKIGGRELKVPYASQSELKGEIAEFKAFKKNPVKYIKKTLNNA